MLKRASGTSFTHLLIRLLLCGLLCEQSLVNCIRNDLGAIVSDVDQAFSEVIMLDAFFWNSLSLFVFHFLLPLLPHRRSHQLWPIAVRWSNLGRFSCRRVSISVIITLWCYETLIRSTGRVHLSEYPVRKRNPFVAGVCSRLKRVEYAKLFLGKAISTDLDLLSSKFFVYWKSRFLSFVMHFHTLSFVGLDGSCRLLLAQPLNCSICFYPLSGWLRSFSESLTFQ